MSCSKTRECKKKKRPFSPLPSISSAVPSFFKIMIGDFRDAMFLPPKFAQTLGGMANKNFYLEDCAGNCWMVKLREINDGSLVFEEGWRDFVLNHSISVGEIVVFKHISIALFTVQIYGISGCERVEFQGKENTNTLKRKRTKNETTPDILCPSKAQKNYKTSDGKHNASVKESSKKDRVEKTFPIRLAGNETAARKYVARNVREHTYSLKESPRDDGHRKLRNSSTMNQVHSEAPNKIIDQGKKIEELGRNSLIVLSDDDVEETDEVIMIKDCSNVDKSNGGAKSSAKEHVKNRKENLAVDKRSANRYFLTTERKSSMVCKEVIEMTPNASVHPGTSQSKHNSKGTNISSANEGKMSVREKAVAVEHNKDRKEGVAACNNSRTRCLLALDKKSSVIDKISVCMQEIIEVAPITSAHPQILETSSSSQDANILEVNEENTSHECNSPTKTVLAEDCTNLETRIKNEDNCEIVAHPFADERLPMVGCVQGQYIAAEGQMTNENIIRNNGSEPEVFRNKLDDKEFAHNSYGRPEDLTPEFVEDKDGNLVPKEFSCKSLVMEERMCYDPVQDSKAKLEANVDASIDLHVEDEGKNLIIAEEFTRNCLVMGDSVCYPVDEDSKDKFEERIDSYLNLGAEDEGGNLIVPKEVVSKSLVRGDDICYVANEDSMDELEVRNGASVAFCAAKENSNVLVADMGVINKSAFLLENVLEAPSSAPLLNCNVDDQGILPPPCKGIIDCNQSEENLGNDADPSRATAVESSPPLVMADVPETPNGPTTMEGDPLPSEIIPGELPEMDAEKVDACLKGEVLAVVKKEIMDSTDFLSLKNVEFSTTASLISESWLLLPEKLPAHHFKKRCFRKVVLLQDPSMNLWPVLYYEGFNFIGFVGGWEDFIIANNLQQGDTCQIDSVSASEPTFKVQFSHVQKPA